MNWHAMTRQVDQAQLGAQLYSTVQALYPICRSITGDGVRATLALLQQTTELELHEVASGTRVLDWTVPQEWNIRDAWIKSADGAKVVDFQQCNLHVVNYSIGVQQRLPLAELRPHLFTLPEQPDLIPYRTSYYEPGWGFCLSQNQLDALPDGDYEVCIDAELGAGHLSYGEKLIRGASNDEVLISAHLCHPSLANDNLSGLAVAVQLAQQLEQLAAAGELHYSYRFLFIPATIGAITWLALNREATQRIHHGLVLSCVGDQGNPTYKNSRRGNSPIDKAMAHVLMHRGDHQLLEFSPYGYDERQYCSPGFNLPVGRFTRSPENGFPEYHTSGDNLDLVTPGALADSYAICLQALAVLENNRRYRNLLPYGEPQLGQYGLYDPVGGNKTSPQARMALLWILNLSDGHHDLLDIAQRSALPMAALVEAAGQLTKAGLIEPEPA